MRIAQNHAWRLTPSQWRYVHRMLIKLAGFKQNQKNVLTFELPQWRKRPNQKVHCTHILNARFPQRLIAESRYFPGQKNVRKSLSTATISAGNSNERRAENAATELLIPTLGECCTLWGAICFVDQRRKTNGNKSGSARAKPNPAVQQRAFRGKAEV